MENTMVKSSVEVMDEQERMIDDKSFREQFIDRVEVLDKVKTMLTVPYFKMFSLKQVAEWYGVTDDTISKCHYSNQNEIENDGVDYVTISKFKDLLIGNRFHLGVTDDNKQAYISSDGNHIVYFERASGQTTFFFPNGTEITIPNRGIRCFSKRAVLRIGMLLRDSEVAKEVRTQLLNIEEKAEQYAPAIVTEAVDEESNIMLEIGKAFASGNLMTFGNACTKMIAFKNRHIAALTEKNSELMETNSKLTERNESLENVNHLLVDKTVRWTNRNTIVRLINCLVGETKMKHKVAWNMLYKHLRYRYGISLRQRAANAEKNGAKKPRLIDFVKDDEWKLVEKTFVALLEYCDMDADAFYKRAIPMIEHKGEG